MTRVSVDGLVVVKNGQEYELVGVKPHLRRDGSETELLVWRSHCADCGAEFLCSTTKVFKAMNRRCPAHVQPLVRVKSMTR
jgi:hypothetical protein